MRIPNAYVIYTYLYCLVIANSFPTWRNSPCLPFKLEKKSCSRTMLVWDADGGYRLFNFSHVPREKKDLGSRI